jgi:hypothetical protein
MHKRARSRHGTKVIDVCATLCHSCFVGKVHTTDSNAVRIVLVAQNGGIHTACRGAHMHYSFFLHAVCDVLVFAAGD